MQGKAGLKTGLPRPENMLRSPTTTPERPPSIFLYVASHAKELETLGLAKGDPELSTVKQARYWRRLTAQVEVRLHGYYC